MNHPSSIILEMLFIMMRKQMRHAAIGCTLKQDAIVGL